VTEFDQSLPPVVCHPGDVNQVILNLVVNAAHAIHEKAKDGEKGQIKVSTKVRGEFAEVAITDTGVGIPEKIRNRIFDPFFTTKDVAKEPVKDCLSPTGWSLKNTAAGSGSRPKRG
jgi:Signal transduction histidine kinase